MRYWIYFMASIASLLISPEVFGTATYTTVVNAESFTISMPPCLVLTSGPRFVYFYTEQKGAGFSFLAQPITLNFRTSAYWSAIYSTPTLYQILVIDTHPPFLITLQVYDVAAGATFWQSIVNTTNNCVQLTTRSLDGASHEADHNAFIATFSAE